MASEIPNEDAYGKMLTDGLRKLELHKDATPAASGSAPTAPDATHEDGTEAAKDLSIPGTSYAVLPSRTASSAHVREGYGFRPTSGFSTPASAVPRETDSPLPDPNGLGWPGNISLLSDLDALQSDYLHSYSEVDRGQIECEPCREGRA